MLDGPLPEADVVAMSLPGTRETYRLMNRERLFRMKQGPVLLNAGRGSTLDTDALCDLLECGRLWKAPGAYITPHISGGSHLAETMERVVRISAANLRAYLSGFPLNNVILRPAIGRIDLHILLRELFPFHNQNH